ncbi:MAG: HD domain-containing phosphohydrolase [Negativicutes bacterium]|nr:HD domain-containing phosphohydrolase [Negativicutes bacterium]
MKSVFAAVASQYSCLEKTTYSKPAMLAISHALEDVVLNFGLNADLFVSFQKFEFFLYEKDRYLQLDKICRRIFIFAQGVDPDQITEFNNTVFVEIDPDCQLVDEWSVIINHPVHPILLSTTEQYRPRTVPGDDFRYFHGFLSFDPDVVRLAVNQTLLNLRTVGREYMPLHISKGPATAAEKETNRKISLFVNRLLNKVETKVTEMLDKNIALQGALQETRRISFEMVQRLCYAAEFRDSDANGHLSRISDYSALLFSMVGKNNGDTENIRYASLMHDIGKIGIPDSILLKPGKLTAGEFEVIKQHTVIGGQILRDSPLELLRMGYDIALSHHEKWDGSGYPYGLKGEEIPLVARVVAIVDVFDALTTKRVYKEAFSIERSLSIIHAERNRHFEGKLIDLFVNNIDSFLELRRRVTAAGRS